MDNQKWKRITKKEFIQELSNRENALLGSWMNLKEDSQIATKILNVLFEFDGQARGTKKVYRKQSNAIQFDNGSWLYFNDIAKCYQHNNVIITIKERYDNWLECHVIDIMGYWLGDYIG